MNKEDYSNTNDSELLMLYREDDEVAKNILFLKYQYIIKILIKKYRMYFVKLNIDYQEIYSECTVGFSDALKRYNDNRDTSLVTFITVCVERRIKTIIRKYNQEKYKILQDVYSLDYDYEFKKLMDSISDKSQSDPLNNMTEKEHCEDLIATFKKTFSKREDEVFSLLIRGYSYKEIAGILKITPKQSDNTIQRIKIKIKKVLEAGEE